MRRSARGDNCCPLSLVVDRHSESPWRRGSGTGRFARVRERPRIIERVELWIRPIVPAQIVASLSGLGIGQINDIRFAEVILL